MWQYVAFAVALVVLGALICWLDPTLKRLREFEAELDARAPLPDADLASPSIAEGDVPLDVLARVRQLFAKHMSYPPEKLLPDDDLGWWWAELDLYYLVKDLEREFGITIAPKDTATTPCNIRDFSAMIARKLTCSTATT
jgi:hypothetical protein